MQVRGTGSNASLLRWFTDRSEARLPTATMVSVPILVYRGAMLAWALWIALALLRWLRWGWGAFSAGGTWKKSPPRVFVPSPYAAGYAQQGHAPQGAPNAPPVPADPEVIAKKEGDGVP